MNHPRQPCRYCGGPKPGGRGRKACDPCLDKMRPIFDRESSRIKGERAKQLRAETGRGPRKLAALAPEGQKWCSRCQQYLPLEDFNPSPSKSLGRSSYCTECHSRYHHANRLRKVFGLTLDEYEALVEQQDGRCAICQTRPRKRRLSVDHNHKTGEIRGLLCTRCNHKLLGASNESAEMLRRAADYLDAPPAPAVIGPRLVAPGTATR